MKTILLFLLVAFFFFSAGGQVQFGARAGMAFNGRSGIDHSNTLTGLQSSVFALFHPGNFIVHLSLGYYCKGYRLTDLSFEDQLGNEVGSGDLNFRFDYLELSVPVQASVTMGRCKLFPGIGPYIAYAMDGKVLRRNVSGEAGNEPKKRSISFNNSGDKRFDIGLSILVSAQLKRLILSVNYDQGLINSNSRASKRSLNRSPGITIGYLFKY